MNGRTILHRYTTRVVALAVVGGLYGAAHPPTVAPTERAELAARFRFSQMVLPELSSRRKSVRRVHPSLDGIAAWISSVGASVALNDLDGDGLPNDVCSVDPRTDEVVVAPAPGTPPRYAPFALDPSPLAYDRMRMAPMGCLPGDLNEDGLVDLLIYYWGRTPIAFLRPARPPGSSGSLLEYVPVDVRAPIERWYTNAATRADVDGDGHVDLIVGNYFADGARILDAGADGREAMQTSMSRARNSGRHHVLLFMEATAGPRPSVVFDEAKDALPDADAFGWTLAVGAADLDDDLLPEVYFANDFGSDQLLHNRSRPGAVRFVPLHGIKRFTTPNSKVLGRDSFKGMGVDFGDLNDDGWPDIYVSNIAAEYALEESHFMFLSTGDPVRWMRGGVAPYVDDSERLGLSRSGWAWDAKLADFDNDGVLEAMQATGFVRGLVNRWPELHELAMGNDQLLTDPRSWPRVRLGDDLSGHEINPFFVRGRDGRYADVARAVGLDDASVTRGIAIADIDGDGLLDFAVANQWATSYLYANRSPRAHAFLGLHLLRPVAERSSSAPTIARPGHPTAETPGHPAIGATIAIDLPNGRRLTAQVDGGNGHSGRRSADLHVGLGDVAASTPLGVEIRWRTSDGRAAHASLRLIPGWHTVLLGRSED